MFLPLTAEQNPIKSFQRKMKNKTHTQYEDNHIQQYVQPQPKSFI